MRIAFLTQWFDPEGGSAAVPGAMVRALAAHGHDVTVVTGFPNYPHGKLYDGYRLRLRQSEVRQGIPVHRVWLYPSHDRSPLRRIANYLSFMLTCSSLGALIARRSEVALVYSTPATIGLAGVVLRRVMGRPYVLYIQDVWPDVVTSAGMIPQRVAPLVERLLLRFTAMVYRNAARIAVISPGMKTLLVERGVDAAKIDVIYNWVDEAHFHPVDGRGVRKSANVLELMYAGSVGDIQGLEVAVEAMSLLPETCDARLRIVGSGVALTRLKRLAEELQLTKRVRFEDPRPIDEIARVMSEADVQLVSLRDEPLYHVTMPSKIQAILACGLPLVVSAPGDAARLPEESGAGVSVPAGDPKALAEAITQFAGMTPDELHRRGDQGRRFYESRLCARVGSEALAASLRKALEQR